MKTLVLAVVLMASPVLADGLKPGEHFEMVNESGNTVQSCSLGFGDGSLSTCRFKLIGNWTLYSQTYGGRIGVVHGLTKEECEVQRKQALGQPATDEEKAAAKMFSDEVKAKQEAEEKQEQEKADEMKKKGYVISGLSVASDFPSFQTSVVTGLQVASTGAVRTTFDVQYAECRDKPLP